MKVFISWSDGRSRILAEGLKNWLPKVIQAIKPFFSPEIEKGTRGIAEINSILEGTSFGIICLTPENLDSIWIHYEAGALSKIEGARIWTLLLNLAHSDVRQPLAQFQHTLAQKEDIFLLLQSVNKQLPEPLEKEALSESFERWWPDLEKVIAEAKKLSLKEMEEVSKNVREDREVLDEILEILRNQERKSPQRRLSQRDFGVDLVDVHVTEDFFKAAIFELSLSNMKKDEIENAIEETNDRIRRFFSAAISLKEIIFTRSLSRGNFEVIFFLPITRDLILECAEQIKSTSKYKIDLTFIQPT